MPLAKKLVAVVIPAFGNPDLLLKTLKSVYAQKGDFDLTVIVVDDHSPEPIKHKILRHFPLASVIRNKTNLKSGPARNQALPLIGKAKYVAFLDADDLWEPTFIQESINNIVTNNSIGSLAFTNPLFDKGIETIIRTKVVIFSSILDLFKSIFYLFNHKTLPRSAFSLCHLSHLLFLASAVKKIKFDPHYNFGGEDWKFTIEAMDKGKIAILPKRLVRFRYHLRSSTRLKENIINKWNSYQQLFSEISKRKIAGPMVWLFRLYIQTSGTQ